MATIPTKPTVEDSAGSSATAASWPAGQSQLTADQKAFHTRQELRPAGGDALQALLAFSAMHQQVRQRRALAARLNGFDTIPRTSESEAIKSEATEFETEERFILNEVLQLVAERAIAITGADGLGIALAENNEIVLRASAGTIKPDVGARIQRDSAFSGACFRTAQIIRCDDTETDDRVNLYACRQLGARSMVAVPLCGRRRVIGLLVAVSAEPFGFNDSDVGSLELLAELILGALKPEDEDRFAESAQVAEAALAAPAIGEAPPVKVAAVAQPAPQVQEEPKAAAANSAVVVEPGPAPELAAELRAEPESVTQEDFPPEIAAKPPAPHHPGIG